LKGHFFTANGKVFKTTTPEAKRLLKCSIKGIQPIPRDEDELAPVIDLDKIDKDAATAAFLKIEMWE
jgi:hypothetical protein